MAGAGAALSCVVVFWPVMINRGGVGWSSSRGGGAIRGVGGGRAIRGVGGGESY